MPTYTANMTVSGFSGNHYQHQIIIDLLQQDIATNRSQIRRRQRLARIGTVEAWNNNNTSTRSLSTTGIANTSGNFSYDFRGQPSNHVITLVDQTYWVDHNPDGTLTFVTSGNMNVSGMTAAANIGSQNYVLPSIPRGPRVHDGTGYKHSVAYVHDGTGFKVATPYVNDAGTWKIGAN